MEKRLPPQIQNPVVFITTSIPGPYASSPPQVGSGVSASFGDFSSGISTGGNLVASGNITLGNSGKSVSIASNSWSISDGGAATGFTALTVKNLTIGSGSDISGNAVFHNNVNVFGALYASSTLQVTDTGIFYGNLGVGTTTPGAAFAVQGNILGSGILNLTGSGTSTITGPLTVGGIFTANSSSLIISSTSTVSNQFTVTRVPTQTHTFASWSPGTAGSNVADSSLLVNPSSAMSDTNLFGLAVNNSPVFLVDADGDVFAKSVTLSGGATLATTTISGNMAIEGNTTLGDAPNNDSTLINGLTTIYATSTGSALTIWNSNSGGNALDIKGGQGASPTDQFLVSSNGQAAFGTSTFSGLSQLTIGATSTAAIPLTLKGVTGQAANLFQILNSANSQLLTVDLNGNLGIGTSSPSNLFSVQGNGLFSGNLSLANLTATGTLTFSGQGANMLASFNNSNQLVSTSTPTLASLSATSTTATSTFAGGLTVNGTGFVVNQGVPANSFNINTSGNVGIGTTGPGAKLDITGSGTTDASGTSGLWIKKSGTNALMKLTAGGGADATSVSIIQSADYANTVNYYGGSANTSFNLALNPYGGNVGIGTTTPGSNLSVVSGLSVGTNYGIAAPSNGAIIEGNVGIGTTAPGQKLDIQDAGAGASAIIRLHHFEMDTGNAGIEFQHRTDTVPPKAAIISTGVASWGRSDLYFILDSAGDANGWDASTDTKMIIKNSGNVGIGTTSPNPLGYGQGTIVNIQSTVNSPINGGILELGTSQSDGAGRILGIIDFLNTVQVSMQGVQIMGVSEGTTANNRGARLIFSTKADGGALGERMRIDSTGNVGIGTTSPNAQLQINPASGVEGLRVVANNAVPIGLYTGSTRDAYISNNPNLVLQSASGNDIIIVPGNATAATFKSGGNVGIGSTSPSSNLVVNGADNKQLYLSRSFNPAQYVIIGQGGDDVTFKGSGASQFTFSNVTNGTQLFLNGSGNVGIGTASPNDKLEVAGAGCFDTAADTHCTSAHTAGDIYYGSAHANWTDIAEKYPSLGRLEPGDIVALDGENMANATTSKPYVKKSSSLANETTMGIVSTRPGLVLGDDYGKSEDYSIALSGRVPVKVSLENGPIKIGDRITSSSQAGVGMKATQDGVTVGIALENFDGSVIDDPGSSIGKILAFVNLGYSKLDSATTNLAVQPPSTSSLPFAVDMQSGKVDIHLLGDLYLQGHTIFDVQKITSSTQKWSISEDGKIIAQQICLEDICIGKPELKALLINAGLLQPDTPAPASTPEPVPDASSTPIIDTTISTSTATTTP